MWPLHVEGFLTEWQPLLLGLTCWLRALSSSVQMNKTEVGDALLTLVAEVSNFHKDLLVKTNISPHRPKEAN